MMKHHQFSGTGDQLGGCKHCRKRGISKTYGREKGTLAFLSHFECFIWKVDEFSFVLQYFNNFKPSDLLSLVIYSIAELQVLGADGYIACALLQMLLLLLGLEVIPHDLTVLQNRNDTDPLAFMYLFIYFFSFHLNCCCSVTKPCPTLCNPMNRSTPGLPVHRQLPSFHPNPCPSGRWCHPTISASVVPFSSRPQSQPASRSFQMSQLFAWGGQSIGVSASAAVLPMNTQDWLPLGWTGWISLQSTGI